jgi:hypothetical protein
MGCNFLDHAANKGVFGPIALEQFLDQGYVYFDDTGNVKVVLNNKKYAVLASERSLTCP